MRNNRQQQPSNRQSRSNRNGNAQRNDEKRYYSLITTGLGYVNYLNERKSERGTFTTCQIKALVGDANQTPKEYRQFNVIVSNDGLQNLLWDHEQDILDERNVFVKFRLNDVKPQSYLKQDGTIVESNNAYLIGIEKLWVEGELMYEAPAHDDENEATPEPSQNVGRKNRPTNNSTGRSSQQNRQASSNGQRNGANQRQYPNQSYQAQ